MKKLVMVGLALLIVGSIARPARGFGYIFQADDNSLEAQLGLKYGKVLVWRDPAALIDCVEEQEATGKWGVICDRN